VVDGFDEKKQTYDNVYLISTDETNAKEHYINNLRPYQDVIRVEPNGSMKKVNVNMGIMAKGGMISSNYFSGMLSFLNY